MQALAGFPERLDDLDEGRLIKAAVDCEMVSLAALLQRCRGVSAWIGRIDPRSPAMVIGPARSRSNEVRFEPGSS